MKTLKWLIVILFWVKSKIVLFVSKQFKSWEYKTAKPYQPHKIFRLKDLKPGTVIWLDEPDEWLYIEPCRDSD